VSPDFRQHACRFFVEPLLAAHDKSAVEVYAYAELQHEDAATQRYKGLVDHWVPTRGMPDEALAERIRTDRIDILVDLAGHTRGNRLGVFALKPAPVSVSWMGYGSTTGLAAIDYYLTDEASAPLGSEGLFSEAPWRLAGMPYAVYRPDAGMGECGPLPAQRHGHITLGTLSRSIRLNDRVLRVWAAILQRLPQARLVVDSRNFDNAAGRDTLYRRFAALGVSRERLDIGCHSPPWDVLRGIDIGLDCFPHNSGTTLFESLYMGVPFVTLAARPSVGRIGSAILQGLGRPEWIAQSEDEYIDKVVALASDLPALAALRAGLRTQMHASALMDEARFAQAVESAYRQMFARWANNSQVEPSPLAAPVPTELSAEDMQALAQLFQAKRYEEGVVLARALSQRFPNNGFVFKALGVMLQPLGRGEEALAAKQRAAELLPHDAEAQCNLGMQLQAQGQLTQALVVLQRALQCKPDYREAHNNLGITFQKLGRLDESLAHFQQALALDPSHESIHSNMLFTLNYHPDMGAEQIAAHYRDYDQRFGLPLRGQWQRHDNVRSAERRLRVGYVSPDFRRHACQRFLEPLLAAHDKGAVEVFAYAELAREDEVTQRYRGLVDHWVPTRGRSDDEIAQRVRADGIDILVDLAGHTVGNRLGVFARKPAPVSLSWLGFGYTTGLSSIDYFLTDAVATPVGSEALFAELPWRLPAGWCFRPDAAMGEPGPLPALTRGHVTLGTLTRAVRINHHTVRVWCEILRQLPDAHLVVDSGSFSDPAAQQAMRERFTAQGIAPERLHIGYHSPPWDTLRGIDIGLDCFPHNSGTTLFETLYMGVPYVSLASRPSVGRLGSSILHGAGCDEWIAEDEQAYVAKVVALAADLPALADIRGTLRTRLQRSILMDEAGFARATEQAFRAMFSTWCAGSAHPLQAVVARAQGIYNEGNRLHDEGDLVAAEACYRRALVCVPELTEAHTNLGLLLQQQGRWSEAVQSLREAVAQQPTSAKAHYNLGACLQHGGELAQAEASYRAALAAQPNFQNAQVSLSLVLRAQGQVQESERYWRQTLRMRPDFAAGYRQLASVLRQQQRHEEALACLVKAGELEPDTVAQLQTLSLTLRDLGRFAAAEAACQRAVVLEPESAVAWAGLAELYNAVRRLLEAEHGFRRAIELDPNLARAHGNLGLVLQNQGRLAEAEASMRRALALQPDDAVAHGNLLFVLNYHPDKTGAQVFEEYRRYEQRFFAPLRSEWRAHGNARLRTPDGATRRLKVGYVSPDFRQHSVVNFLEPLLAHHDRSQVDVYAYAQLQREDAATARYKGLVDHWVPTSGLGDAQLAERIRADGIDILVDLAGHTGGNRLGVFARKPAPVSLSWMGYGYTTGLSAIDYYLTDEASAPTGSEAVFAEQPWRLPVGWAYRPAGAARMGEPGPLPAERHGVVTFGTLTRAIRINEHTVRVWAALLARVPGSRLVIDSTSYRDEATQEALAARFTALGIARDRLRIGCHSPPWDLLRDVDIGLDCFPHNSGTTLFETLYMGIPFVTLAGRPSVGCLGSSILTGVGHPQWIANTEHDYVEKAAALASDLPRLAALRAGLRTQMQQSLLMNEAAFAREVEAAYRAMFERWEHETRGPRP
jgi:predicted O-linked N-acetylglucosamine transferase (SPINDLY family)